MKRANAKAEVENPEKAQRREPAAASDREWCGHYRGERAHLEKVLSEIKTSKHAVACEHCWDETLTRSAAGSGEEEASEQHHKKGLAQVSNVWVCMQCGQYLCAGVVAEDKPRGHAQQHAQQERHWWAAQCNDPDVGYCFKCEKVILIEMPKDEAVGAGAVDDGAGGAASGLASGHGNVIRGMPNLGNTCYFNAVLQSLLALNHLRLRMLGPDAPMGSIGMPLKELFMETSCANVAGGMLNPENLLLSVRSWDQQFIGSCMHDSHDLFLALINGLDLEETDARKQVGAPNVTLPTIVNSIFQFQLSSTLSCTGCPNTSVSCDPYFDLSLPVLSKQAGAPNMTVPTTVNSISSFQWPSTLSLTGCLDTSLSSGTLFDLPLPALSKRVADIIATLPTLVNSIFPLQLPGAWSDGCPNSSVSYAPYFDLPLPLPSKRVGAPNMTVPTIVDPIFPFQLPSTLSHTGRPNTSVPCAPYFDLPLPSVVPRQPRPPRLPRPPKSVEQSTRGGNNSQGLQKRTAAPLLLTFEESIRENIKPIAKCDDYQISGSELGEMIHEKAPEPSSESNSTEAEQICQSKGVVHDPLQTQDDQDLCSEHSSGIVEEETSLHSTISLPYEGIDATTEEMDGTSAASENTDDTGPPPAVSPVTEKSALTASGGHVEQNDNVGLGDLSEQEVTAEARERTCTVEDIDLNKALSSNCDDDDVKDSNAPVSVEECLALFFKADKVEWKCEHCYKVAEQLSTNESKDFSSCSTAKKEPECHEGAQKFEICSLPAEKQTSLSSSHDNQTSSRLNQDRRKGAKLDDDEHHVQENQTEEKDNKMGVFGCAIKKYVIRKAPPVLTIQLKRFVENFHGQHDKLEGKVSFKEMLDIQPFMDPRSAEKDNSRYHLVGVIQHSGATLNMGHFLAYVRASRIGGQQQQGSDAHSWFCANDENVIEVSLKNVLNCEAYMLFYERIGG